MRNSAVALGACLVLVLAATPLAAQQRRVVTGLVKDAAGAPVADADVRFVFVARGAECGDPTDDRTVRTGPDGRFRADLLPCAPYRVWCLGKPAEDGARPASAMRFVDSSPFLELDAVWQSRPHPLRIEGLEAWAKFGPFRVRVLPAGVQLSDGTFPILDNTVSVAALPVVPKPTSPSVVLQLLDRRGEVVAAWQPDPDSHEWTWQFPPPTPLQVRVVRRGEGIANAKVFELASTIEQELTGLTTSPPIRNDWRLVGSTNGDGWLTDVVVASPQPAWWVGGPDGSVMTATNHWDAHFYTKVVGDAHYLLLPHNEPLQLRLVTAVPTLAAQRTIFADSGGLRATLRTDDQGHASLVGAGFAIAADHDPAWRQLLPEAVRDRAPTPPIAFSVLPPGLPRRPLNPSWLLQLEVTNVSGGPPTKAQVVLGSHGHVSPWSWHAIPDQAGRLAVVATEDEWLVFAHDEESACTHRIKKEPAAPIRLVLQPLPRMRGKVLDERGRPVAGATLELVETIFRDETLPDLDPGLGQLALWRNPDAIARCTTAADGSFDCRFLLDPDLLWKVRFRSGAKSSRAFELEAATGFVAIVD